MKRCVHFVSFCLVATLTGGIALGRDASAIVKDYDNAVLPKPDANKAKDPAYRQQYQAERAAVLEKQNRLAKELYQSHPQPRRATHGIATHEYAQWQGRVSGALGNRRVPASSS
jgi:hypothetical protein